MSILAYSEILKKVTGIDEKELEKPFIILSRHNSTPKRFKILRVLANNEKSTISSLLKKAKLNRGGGSYLTIRKYFQSLEKEGLLKKEKINKKETWEFSEEYNDLKEFIVK